MQHRKMAVAATLAAGGIALALTVAAQKPAPARGSGPNARRLTLSGADRSFVAEAAQGGMAEVTMGRLALRRGASKDVKRFGQQMVTDHGRANRELLSIASRKHTMTPTTVGREHTAMMRHIRTLSGSAFDRAYIEHMVNDHKQDIAAFQREATTGRDPDIRRWATRMLPILQNHLKMATRINHTLQAGMRPGTMPGTHASVPNTPHTAR